MMKQLWIMCCFLAFSLSTFAQKTDNLSYNYKVDITNIKDDKLQVELTIPPNLKKQKELIFHLPKIVPGTYSIYDFGRFVVDFKVYKKNGKLFKDKHVAHPDDNTWIIKKAKKIGKIVYTVEDTWDSDKGNKVFEPGGTNIEERNLVFNNHGFFGYFEGFERQPFVLEIDRPKAFFGATSLDRTGGDEDTDIFRAGNYMDLADAPIMFCRPDTVVIKVGNADVLVSTYSPNGKVTSKFIAGEIEPILQAQKDYLGGTLPVTKYAFLVYLSDHGTNSGGFGALEHSYSSLYFLPETEAAGIAQTIRDVAAHEFFHIVTPLNVHSEEIHDFDFINPEMSEHLWMYEGVTEYAAGHVQVISGLMPVEEYLNVVSGKIRGASQYDDKVPFTVMSSKCLKEYKDQYGNVYQQGALIGLCLDLKINILSKGTKNLRGLMADLSKEYGKDKAFKDEELFGKITALTYPEIADFFKAHVAGANPLPIKELMAQAGISYEEKGMVKSLSPLGGLETGAIGFNFKNFYVQDGKKLNAFGTDVLGLKQDDEIIKWDGKELNIENINDVLGSYMMSAKEGNEVTIDIIRDTKEMQLKATIAAIEMEQEHVFKLDEEATPEQLKIRKAWLGDYKTEAEINEKGK